MADITTHLDRLAKTVGPMGVAVLEEAKKEILALRHKWHLQHDEIERLREEKRQMALQHLTSEGQWIEETGRLRETLRYYADKSNWYVLYGDQYILVDGGRIARAALEQAQSVTTEEKE